MPIVILHFWRSSPSPGWACWPLAARAICWRHSPIYFLPAGGLWVAYTAAGLALPLLAYAVWVRLLKGGAPWLSSITRAKPLTM